MPRPDEATFVLHGLDVDNRNVRAEIFAQKLLVLLRGIRAADRHANGKMSFAYMLSRLGDGSASVTVREKQITTCRRIQSALSTYEAVATAVYNGERTAERFPRRLIGYVGSLGRGVDKTFSHAELSIADHTVIRIDDFLVRQSEAVRAVIAPDLDEGRDNSFRGLAFGAYDGILLEIDARGTLLRGKLVLSAGGDEIDCVMNKERIPEARDSFNHRVIVEGAAHFDGVSRLPVRIDINAIRPVKESADLRRWRGAFAGIQTEEEEDW